MALQSDNVQTRPACLAARQRKRQFMRARAFHGSDEVIAVEAKRSILDRSKGSGGEDEGCTRTIHLLADLPGQLAVRIKILQRK